MIQDINTKDSLQNAANVLKSGGILIFPTDTVYGIGCLMIEKSIKKLYKIKNRPLTQPTAVLMNRNIFDSKRIEELVLEKYDEEFMSGKMTIIDSVQNYAIDFPKILTKDQTIGIRLPQDPWLEQLIDLTGPIVASSANIKGDLAPSKFSEINEELINKVDLAIKTDSNLDGKASMVYDIASNKVLRI